MKTNDYLLKFDNSSRSCMNVISADPEIYVDLQCAFENLLIFLSKQMQLAFVLWLSTNAVGQILLLLWPKHKRELLH